MVTNLDKEVAKNDELPNISDKGFVMKANCDVDNSRVLWANCDDDDDGGGD